VEEEVNIVQSIWLLVVVAAASAAFSLVWLARRRQLAAIPVHSDDRSTLD
jgi:hypothetical protein